MAKHNNEIKRKRKSNKVPIIVTIIVVVVAIIAGAAIAILTKKAEPEVAHASSNGQVPMQYGEEEWGNRLTYKGQKYRRNTDIRTILFLGVDQYAGEQFDGYNAEEGIIGNAGRADTLIMFLLNDNSETTTVLNISRDTITAVDVYDTKGEYKYTGDMQLCLQYTFGDSPSKSMFLTRRAVSRLMYDIAIDGSVALTMDGIAAIVDMLGGIELTMPKDYSYINENYYEGATVLLNGAEMEYFIRYRDSSVTGSNDERMERASWLISAVFSNLKARGALDFIQEVVDSHPEYITSDCDGKLLKKLSQYTILDDKYRLPGNMVAGPLHDEFYVDSEQLQDLIIQLLYEPVIGEE